MRKEFVISLFLMTILCGSCETAVGNLPVIHPEDAPEISDISPYVKSIEEIPLSDASDGAFASIQKVIVLPSGGFLTMDIRKNVFVFSGNGVCLNRIGRTGRGHGEYTGLQDIAYDTDSGTVILLCLNRVLEYDLSGHYLAFFDIPHFNYDAIAPANDGYCLFAAAPDNFEDLETLHNTVHFYSKEKGEVTRTLVPRKDYIMNTDMISYSGGKGYHIRPLEGEDILYRVNGDSLEQVMKVSFGKEQAPQKSLLNNGRYEIPSYIMSQYFKMPMDFQFTDKHILFTAVGPEGVMHYYLYDNEFSPLGFWKEPDGCMSPVKIASSDSESFYILLNNPSYWREVISSCPLSGDNPTLLKVTFN